MSALFFRFLIPLSQCQQPSVFQKKNLPQKYVSICPTFAPSLLLFRNSSMQYAPCNKKAFWLGTATSKSRFDKNIFADVAIFETSSQPPHVFIHQQLPTPFPPHPRKGLTLWIALLHELGVAPTRPQCVTLEIMYAFLFGNCHKLYGMALISICYLLLNFSKK